MTTSIPDSIEDRIEIDASAERVWRLISEPGWWINDGQYVEHLIEPRDGYVLVTDPVHGAFPIVCVAADEPRYVAYRWLTRTDEPTPDEPAPDGAGTLTEFWIDERPGGVTLRVRESGFGSLDRSEQQLLATIADNVEGWRTELSVARTTCQG